MGRACGFAGLAILCVMIGLSYDLLTALRAGGVCVSLLMVILVFRSYTTARVNHRKTELWLMLDKRHHPPEPYARWAVATALRDAYLRFAQYAALASIILWATALGVSWLAPASAGLAIRLLDAALPPVG